MDIMSLFRTAPTPQAPQAQGPSQVNQPGMPLPGTASSPQTAPNGVVPSASQTLNVGNPDPNVTVSPLDTFKDVWSTPTTPDAVSYTHLTLPTILRV